LRDGFAVAAQHATASAKRMGDDVAMAQLCQQRRRGDDRGVGEAAEVHHDWLVGGRFGGIEKWRDRWVADVARPNFAAHDDVAIALQRRC
jgi:hypothetical protein